jgi:hypothetical protein
MLQNSNVINVTHFKKVNLILIFKIIMKHVTRAIRGHKTLNKIIGNFVLKQTPQNEESPQSRIVV